ncbi:tyrosine-type recombinase/integrase [Luminiphilus sp.]|nr:tyrosine-type recombinase/integrase [Luminiphilus sp.]
MALKKQNFAEGEIAIFDEACVYKRGEYWQFRLWLPKENKYARKSLRTRSESTAVERGKAAYLEIYGNLQQGKSYFSITTKEGVQQYVDFRKRDVELGHIVSGRLATIATHLQHWLSFIGKDTKLKELERTDCENYFYHRQKSTDSKVKQVTVQNEQSTINACIKWLNKNGETHIDGFDFKKLPRLDKGNDAIRRATLSNDEYESLFRAMRSYCAKQNKLDALELRTRKIVQHYVLIAANSGLRVGEQRQLRWSDVQVETHAVSGKEQKLARITVRAETSKVRTTRTLLCRNGQYFERLRELVTHTSNDAYIFSVDGDEMLSKRALLYHWHKMIELADIPERETRDLVPYSLRHFMITQRIMSGLGFKQIADMCGTSVAQIEKTYYHLNDEIRITNAVADYRRREDGTIEVL